MTPFASISIYLLLIIMDLHLVFNIYVKETPTLGLKNTPRLLSKDITIGGFDYAVHQNHSVFSYQEDSEELYVGGSDFVLKLDVDDYHIIENYSLTTTGQQHCDEGPCRNVITVIEKFQDSLFVCGTNGNKPQCWKLFPSVDNRSHEVVESYEGAGFSPYFYFQNSLSLTVDGDLYAAAPLEADGSLLQFRRKAGSRTNVWMYHSWISEPTFISASWVKRENDPDNEKIYIFFREKNSDHSPEADPWISRIARVCKVDEGGSKRFFQNMWTSFLKARLVCGFPEESLYFNRLLDVYVVPAEDWRDTRVYALFTSSWNSTAVCVYSIEMIEEIFENSTFRGYEEGIPSPRPGTCVKNSKNLPPTTLVVVKNYPEMTDWVHPLQYPSPFYTSSNNYTKIAVDQVKGADQRLYNVLLLATDSGKIHKILEAGSEPFIISETQLPNNSTLQAMKLDPKKKKLIVGFSEKISTVDLQSCEEYNHSCAECVLARDPYCSWTTTSGCTPTVPGGFQNIMDGETSVCSTPTKEQSEVKRFKRDQISSVNSRTVHSVAQGLPFYLSCPIDSYHAEYTWEHGGDSTPCLQMFSNCLYLIPSTAKENYGNYDCVSKERDYTKIVSKYQLIEQIIPEVNKQIESKYVVNLKNKASGVIPQIVWITLQVVAVRAVV